MWPLRTHCRIVAVARVDHGVVTVHTEHPAGDVTKELFETAWLPGLPDLAGNPKADRNPMGMLTRIGLASADWGL